MPTRRSIRSVSPAPRASDAPKPHVPSSLSSRAQIELKTGETYRGTLLESEDNWNCQLSGITHTGKDGRVNQLEHAYNLLSRQNSVLIRSAEAVPVG